MKRKNEKNTSLKNISIFLVLVTIIIGIVALSNNNKDLEGELNKEGYTTEEESAFYKKIVTNNTLDDYYNDLANKKASKYEEYYISKESNDFIELKMNYEDDVTTALNINSDLEDYKIEFNYELSYKDAHLILEGTSSNDFTCNSVLKEKVSEETINTYCDMIKSEIDTFITRRDNLMKNKKIKEAIRK